MAIRGRTLATGGILAQDDLDELTDALACRIYERLGQRAYALTKQDVSELILPYIDDLAPADQRAIPWLVWDLLQEGAELELG